MGNMWSKFSWTPGENILSADSLGLEVTLCVSRRLIEAIITKLRGHEVSWVMWSIYGGMF